MSTVGAAAPACRLKRSRDLASSEGAAKCSRYRCYLPHFGGFTTVGYWHDVASQNCVDAMLENILTAMFGQAKRPTTPATPRVTQAQPAVSALESDCVRLRAPLRDVDLVLSRVSEVWLLSLPRLLRPAHLCVAYPRVVNRLALCWGDPALTERLLDDLLVGRRGKRKGFPRPVAEELLRLRRFHDHHREVEGGKRFGNTVHLHTPRRFSNPYAACK